MTLLADKYGHSMFVGNLDDDIELLVALPGRDSHSIVLTRGQAQALARALNAEASIQASAAYTREWAAKGHQR